MTLSISSPSGDTAIKTAIRTADMESYSGASEDACADRSRVRSLRAKKRIDVPPQAWSQRYLAYRLVSRYTNLNYSVEERELARLESQQLQDRFKFDLAMYAAHAHLSPRDRKLYPNPTLFGDDAIRLIKLVVLGRGRLNYRRLTQIFMDKVAGENYLTFKQLLANFLAGGDRAKDWTELLRQQIGTQLLDLYSSKNGEIVNEALIFRTCNRAIELLTTEDGKTPSQIFTAKIACGMPLFLTLALLKLLLISPKSLTHLERAIAHLLQYYEKFTSNQCQSVIQFLEMFQIVMAVYANDVEYNLVRITKLESSGSQDNGSLNLEDYRVFARLKSDRL